MATDRKLASKTKVELKALDARLRWYRDGRLGACRNAVEVFVDGGGVGDGEIAEIYAEARRHGGGELMMWAACNQLWSDDPKTQKQSEGSFGIKGATWELREAERLEDRAGELVGLLDEVLFRAAELAAGDRSDGAQRLDELERQILAVGGSAVRRGPMTPVRRAVERLWAFQAKCTRFRPHEGLGESALCRPDLLLQGSDGRCDYVGRWDYPERLVVDWQRRYGGCVVLHARESMYWPGGPDPDDFDSGVGEAVREVPFEALEDGGERLLDEAVSVAMEATRLALVNFSERDEALAALRTKLEIVRASL